MNSIDKSHLTFEIFKRKHFQAYKSWFQNKRIRTALYSIDEEWLDYVLHETDGIEFAVLKGGYLVGVVGITLPKETAPYYVINNLAVHPSHFGEGFGKAILEKLLQRFPLRAEQCWVAYVEKINTDAQQFFAKCNWTRQKFDKKEDDLIRFEKYE